MEELPASVWVEVFTHLTVPDLLRVRGVCRLWKKWAEDPLVWLQKSLDDAFLKKEVFEVQYYTNNRAI